MQKAINLTTPGKINLFLNIKEKLKNGYHSIETIFLPTADIQDEITIFFTNNNEITIQSLSDNIPLDKTNLCHKAASAYSEFTGIKPNWIIEIKKNIPVTAGMGGGSSDAAAVLRILQYKYNKLNDSELLLLAAKLGADVPFFLNPSPSAATGIGENLIKININFPYWVVILAPLFPVSAKWAYENIKKQTLKPTFNEAIEALQTGSFDIIVKTVFNELEFALYEKFPILNILKSEMSSIGLNAVTISGSGPTLFGLCKTEFEAKNAVHFLKQKYQHLMVAYTHIAASVNQPILN